MEENRPDEVTPEEAPCWDDAYSEDGVDLTLIRWMLSLTPAERLQMLQGHVDAVWSIWNATGRAPVSEPPPGSD
jgi:hypothetical protein